MTVNVRMTAPSILDPERQQGPTPAVATMSLRKLLTLGVFLVAAPLFGLGLYLLGQFAGSTRQTVNESLVKNARLLAELVDNEIETHLAVVTSVAAMQSLDLADSDKFRTQVAKALETLSGAWINIFDPSGRMLQSTLIDVSKSLPPRAGRDVMDRAWRTGKPQLSNVVLGNITQRQNAFLEYPVFRNGAPWYSIVIGLSTDRFYNLIRGKFDADAVVGILDADLKFVARIPEHDGRVGTPASESWREAIARSKEGVYDGLTLEGMRTLTAYAPTRYGWTTGVGRPVSALERPYRNAFLKMVAVGLMSLVATGLLGLAVSRHLDRVMADLVADARALGEGAPVVERKTAIQEAAEINHAMSAASEELERRDRELRISHDSFRHLVTHSPFGIYAVDADFKLAKVSDGAQKVFANVPRPLIGRDFAEVMHHLWPEPFASEALARFRHTLTTGEAYHGPSTVEHRRDVDAVEAYDWKIERVVLPDGRPGVVCHFYDLTERERQEERIRVLMQEVDHRSKNILSLVQAIARQTASNEPRDFVARFEERIQALSASHDLLIRNGWRSVALEDLLRSQLGHFKGLLDDRRITMSGPDVRISPAAAQTIGMAIHELGTNAGKYGALSNDTGRVAISWSVNDNPTPVFSLMWTELGGPTVTPPTRRGFGWMVVSRQAKVSLHAEVALDYEPSGVVWRIQCNLADIAEGGDAVEGGQRPSGIPTSPDTT